MSTSLTITLELRVTLPAWIEQHARRGVLTEAFRFGLRGHTLQPTDIRSDMTEDLLTAYVQGAELSHRLAVRGQAEPPEPSRPTYWRFVEIDGDIYLLDDPQQRAEADALVQEQGLRVPVLLGGPEASVPTGQLLTRRGLLQLNG